MQRASDAWFPMAWMGLLADLLVHEARRFSPTAEGEARAKNATEAFQYRHVQTLIEMTDRFRLNTKLPILFDKSGEMEVDLLDVQARIAIELNGPQHLSDPEAYRRDCHKDALLQEQGYFVLRFLAEDVGKRLDYVLDTVAHVLTRRKRAEFQSG